ncbi:heterokaryon incompatibility protein-domain-containing protein [Coniochaeta sp. 2T2.1]|nr:heterokaryon incompatibility protein-domain-containing protein [Coniochaeta sp. 2T2.1]
MQPSYFKMKIWHRPDPMSGFLHQVVNFEVPGSDHKTAKTKQAEIYAVPDTASSRFLKQRVADPDLSSGSNSALARSWTNECISNHPACSQGSSAATLPTRVIEVLPPSGTDMVRLHLITGRETDARYAALSYCWGKAQTCLTTSTTLPSHIAGIPLASLHKTIRDAVLTTRELGIPYLWVDALCIIQDSDSDKSVEIAKMGDIYTNATVTISAAGARDCDEGFLTMRPDIKERYDQKSEELPYLGPDGSVGRIYLVPIGHDALNDAHKETIYERAWTHQERMLSPRMLTYGHRKLSWQCLTLSHCDFDLEDMHYGSATLDIRRFLHGAYLSSPGLAVQYPDKPTLHRWWRETVNGYSQGRLTSLPDKLVALSATARRFASALGSQYVHGLWQDDLARGLMWYSYRSPRIRLPDHFRRPGLESYTWSWASVNGPVGYPQVHLDREPVLTARASYMSFGSAPADQFGDSVKVYLRLQGHALGPFAIADLARFFPSRTREIETEEPNAGGMGWIYPDENDELLYASMVQSSASQPKHEYWLFELSRQGRRRIGLVVRATDNGAFTRAGLYSMNTLLPEAYQAQWEGVAAFRDVLML